MKTYTFWKDNKNDQEYTLTLDELKEKYLAYLKTKEADWILYYGHQTVWSFVASDDGLRSVVEIGRLDELKADLMETRHALPCYQTTNITSREHLQLVVREASGGKFKYECTVKQWDLGMPFGYGDTIQEAIEDFLDGYESQFDVAKEEIKYRWAS